MRYEITFTYMDGGEFHLKVHPDDFKHLIESLGKSEVYFSETRGIGVWLPSEKIRYFHVEKVDEQGNRIRVSNSEICGEDSEEQAG